jgi:hypothetical protein
MSGPIRIDIPNVVYESTIRCQHSRFLLLPQEEFNDLMLGAIGRGLHLYPNVRLYDLQCVSNHMHKFLSSTDGISRSLFEQYVNHRISSESKRRYGWKRIFERPARPIATVTHEDQLERFRYFRAHGLKENLVARADDLPCVSALPFLRYGTKLEGTFVWRDEESKALRRVNKPKDLSAFRERYPVTFAKLPALEHLSWEQIQEYTDAVVKELEAEYDAKRTRPPLGREAILAQHPFNAPAHSKSSPAPLVHCADRKLKRSFLRLARYLTDALRTANRRVKAGEKDVVFPPFCHPARLPYVSWERAAAGASNRCGPDAMSQDSEARPNAPPPFLQLLEEEAPLLPA